MRFMSLDLELEQPNTSKDTPDSATDKETIIQVGVTVFDSSKGQIEVLETKQYNVHYPHKLSAFIKQLTKITDEEVNNSILSLEDIKLDISKLAKEYKVEPYIIEWGNDFRALYGRVISKDDKKKYYFKSSLNIKPMYQVLAVLNGYNPQGGLAKSLHKLGGEFKCLRIEGKNKGAHNATVDSYNTALIFGKLQELMRK